MVVVGLSFAIPVQALGRIVPGRALIDEETVARKPGPTRATADLVMIGAEGLDDPSGSILFTTVTIDNRISIFDWLQSEVDDDIDLRRRVDVLGTRSVDENSERNLKMMRGLEGYRDHRGARASGTRSDQGDGGGVRGRWSTTVRPTGFWFPAT